MTEKVIRLIMDWLREVRKKVKFGIIKPNIFANVGQALNPSLFLKPVIEEFNFLSKVGIKMTYQEKGCVMSLLLLGPVNCFRNHLIEFIESSLAGDD